MAEERGAARLDTSKFFDPVEWRRLPNLVPRSTYELPASDRDLPDDVRELLRAHPLAYVFPDGDRYLRCPTCEQWTAGRDGCDVRQAVVSGDVREARRLHGEREWPAQTGRATTRFRGMKSDYRLVTFKYTDGTTGGSARPPQPSSGETRGTAPGQAT